MSELVSRKIQKLSFLTGYLLCFELHKKKCSNTLLKLNIYGLITITEVNVNVTTHENVAHNVPFCLQRFSISRKRLENQRDKSILFAENAGCMRLFGSERHVQSS